MLKKFLITLAFFSYANLVAQEGHYFISQYTPIEDTRSMATYAIQQDQHGKLFFANREGLLQFDGQNWEIIATDFPVFSIFQHDSTLYMGGKSGFGSLEYTVYGTTRFQSIRDSLDDLIDQIVFHQDNYYFKGERTLYLEQDSASDIRFEDELLFVFSIDSRLFVQTTQDLWLVEGGEKVPADSAFMAPTQWVFCEELSDGHLLGTSNGALFMYAHDSLRAIVVEDDGYLTDSRLIGGQQVSDKLVAIATLRGGVVFLNTDDWTLEQIVNFHTGLPDNQIQHIFTDRDEGVWVGHNYGYSRIAPDMPFRNYSYYPGLDGNLYTTLNFDGTTYAGTNLGLYYLDKVENYDEVVYYVKKNPKTDLTKEEDDGILSFLRLPRSSQSKQKSDQPKESAKDQEKKKGGLFSFLKKDDKQEEKPSNSDQEKKSQNLIEKIVSNEKPTTRTRPRVERRVKKELQSITYVYKKIENINGRISQLLPLHKGSLLASGLDGAFLVADNKSNEIYENAVRYSYYFAKEDLLLISTYDGRVLSLVKENRGWEPITIIDGLQENVEYIFSDRTGRLWLLGSQTLYWVDLMGTSVLDAGELEIENDYLDPIVGIDDAKEGLTFLHSRGIFQYDGDSLTRASIWDIEKPERYIASNGYILISDGREWHLLSQEKTTDEGRLSLLNVFDNIVSMDYQPASLQLWAATGDNSLYRIEAEKEFDLIHSPRVKQIRSVNDRLLPIKDNLQVEQENSSLAFHFQFPEYSGLMQIDYRYKLKGLSDEWSEWSPNYRTIEFAYLPPNSYTLQVETRNIFGQEKTLEPIYFRVVPPYWKRPWFYALEFTFFGVLLFISFTLNRNKSKRYAIINRVLTFLTIILVIEFFQTVAENNLETNTSPVLDFFIQVLIALSLLPVEGFIRKKLSQNKKEKDEAIEDLLQIQVKKLKSSIRGTSESKE